MLMVRSSLFFLFATICISAMGLGESQAGDPPSMPFEGQMASLCADIEKAMEQDPILREHKKFRIGRVICDQSRDVNFEPRIIRGIEKTLAGRVDEKSKIALAGKYQFLESESADNAGFEVLVIKLTFVDNKGRELGSFSADTSSNDKANPSREDLPPELPAELEKKIEFSREINSSADIAVAVGATVSFESKPTESKPTFQERNKLVSNAFESPSFGLIEGSKTQVTTPGGKRYAVEIIKGPIVSKEVKKKNFAAGMKPVVPIEKRGHAYVPIAIGEAYAFHIYNYDLEKAVLAKIRIDGLDSINTFNEDVLIDANGKETPLLYAGYTLPAATNTGPALNGVYGWLRTTKEKAEESAYEFVINKFGEGVASKRMATSGVGVITVEFYEELKLVGGTRGVGDKGETGKGQAIKLDLKVVNVKTAQDPTAIISIRYNDPNEVE